MDAMNITQHAERLRQRRARAERTLRHIEAEQSEAEQNTDWLDQAAYESRISLLNHLSQWYTSEISRIDQALERMAQKKYGICCACNCPIEADRLEAFPQAAFCGACQQTREDLQRL